MAAQTSFASPANRPRDFRLYLWWTAALVVTALGGAGLAVAADRPGNPVERPELTYRADVAAQPWIDRVAPDLDAADNEANSLSGAGADVLGSLQALDLAGASTALGAGDLAAADVATIVARLHETDNLAQASIERWRLGPQTASVFDQVDAAIAGAEALPTDWSGVATTSRTMTGLVQALSSHDQAVSQAKAAAGNSNWDGALAVLNGAAASSLGLATSERDELAQSATVTTLDDLLARERAHDVALTALYQYLAGGGVESGDQFDALQAAVTRAQAALPADNGTLMAVVAETAALPIADRLLAMDEAHGAINDALEAISDAKFGAPAP